MTLGTARRGLWRRPTTAAAPAWRAALALALALALTLAADAGGQAPGRRDDAAMPGTASACCLPPVTAVARGTETAEVTWRPRDAFEAFEVQAREFGRGKEWFAAAQVNNVRGELRREVQVVRSRADVGSMIGAGFFRLSLQPIDGTSDLDPESPTRTEPIAFDASADELRASLEALGSVGRVHVTRSGPDPQGGYSWTIVLPHPELGELFEGSDPLLGRDLPLLSVTANTLDAVYNAGRDPSVVVFEQNAGGSVEIICKPFDLEPCHARVHGLRPSTGYQFRVRARQEAEWTPFSWPSDLLEMEALQRARPPPPPFEAASVAELSHQHVVVAWRDAPPELQVQLAGSAAAGENEWKWLSVQRPEVGSMEALVEASGLDPSASYTLRARAAHNGGWTAFDTKTITTLPQSRQTSTVRAAAVGSTQVELSWAVKNERAVEYQVQARPLVAGRFSTEQMDGDARKWAPARVQDAGHLQRTGPRAEVQVIATRAEEGGQVDAGTFQLGFPSPATASAPLPYDASEEAVKAALVGLGAGVVSVTRARSHNGLEWTVVFDAARKEGDLPTIAIVSETISRDASAPFTGAGGAVTVRTEHHGTRGMTFAVNEQLRAVVEGLDPFSWYSFRVRELYRDPKTGQREAMAWSAPTAPLRTAFAPASTVGGSATEAALRQVPLDDNESLANAVLLDAGSGPNAARATDDLYQPGVAVGGTLQHPAGGHGMVVVRPVSSREPGIVGSARPRVFHFSGGASQKYEIPDDPLVDLLEIRAWGAGGAAGTGANSSLGLGGAGAFAQALVHIWDIQALEARQERRRILSLEIQVGGGGLPPSGGTGGRGGAHGGGAGGDGVHSGGGGGGGASAVLIEGQVALVAAGGGGGGSTDFCCAHGGSGGALQGKPGVAPSGREYAALQDNSEAYLVDVRNVERGFAPGADFSSFATPGAGASSADGVGGSPGLNGAYRTALEAHEASGAPGALRHGGSGGNGQQGGGGGGGGLYGGGGGGAGVDSSGGGGGSSYVRVERLATFAHAGMHAPPGSFAKPAAPKVQAIGPRLVAVEWARHSPGQGFKLERATGAMNEDFQTLRYVPRESPPAIEDTTVEPGRTYRYRVRAVTAPGGSELVGHAATVVTPKSETNAWQRLTPVRAPGQPLKHARDVLGLNESAVDDFLHATGQLESVADPYGAPPLGTAMESEGSELAAMMPLPRFGHTAVLLDGLVYVFGGYAERALRSRTARDTSDAQRQQLRVSGELWRLDPEQPAWERLDASDGILDDAQGVPPPRAGHSAVAFEDKMVVFGGIDSGGVEGPKLSVERVGLSNVTRTAGGERILSYSSGERLSSEEAFSAPQERVMDDLWALDTQRTTAVTFQSSAPASGLEGTMLHAEAALEPGSEAANAKGLCFSRMDFVEVELAHPCPNDLKIWLVAPDGEGRRREGDYGTLLLDVQSSSHRYCVAQGGSASHVLTLRDEAARALAEYTFTSGTFRPAAPLGRYCGMRFDPSDKWTLRVTDTARDGSPEVDVVRRWSLSARVFPCQHRPAWRPLEPADGRRPPARHGHKSYSTADSVVIFGGLSPSLGVLDDVWSWSFADSNWTKLQAVDDLSTRRPISVAALLLSNSALGPVRLQPGVEVDRFDFVTAAWDRVPVSSGESPPPRDSAALLFEPTRSSLILLGGRTATGPLGDAWRLELRNTSALTLDRAVCSGRGALADEPRTAAGFLPVSRLILRETCRRWALG